MLFRPSSGCCPILEDLGGILRRHPGSLAKPTCRLRRRQAPATVLSPAAPKPRSCTQKATMPQGDRAAQAQERRVGLLPANSCRRAARMDRSDEMHVLVARPWRPSRFGPPGRPPTLRRRLQAGLNFAGPVCRGLFPSPSRASSTMHGHSGSFDKAIARIPG